MSLRSVPVDTGRLTGFMCASVPQVRADRVTGEIRTDRATGLPQYEVFVLVGVEGEREPSVISVRVAGEPAGLEIGKPVRLFDLIERKWEMDGRTGVTYSASAVTPVPASAGAPTPAAAEASGGRAAGGKGVAA
jgi:hypothetical protein